MTALSLLGENQSRGWAPYTPSTWSDVIYAGVGVGATRHELMPALFVPANQRFQERDDLIKERFQVNDPFDIIDTSDIEEKYTNPTMQGRIDMLNEKQARLDAYISEQRASNPNAWSGIRTKAEIEESVKDIAKNAYTAQIEAVSRADPIKATVGSLVGGVIGSFTDPINLITLPLGAASGMSVLRAMGAEAVVNMAIEATQTPAVAEWQKKLGYKYGIGEAAADIGMAGVGGAAFTGIVRGIGHGIRAIGSRSARILDESALRAPNYEMHDAFNYQSRVAHIDETIPIERPMQREDIVIQRKSLQETQDAVENYRQPDLSEAEQRFEVLREPTVIGSPQRSSAPEFKQDNPGGEWLQTKQKYADEDIVKYEGQGAAGKGLNGSVTGRFVEPVELPVEDLTRLKGANNEETFRDTLEKSPQLKKSIEEKGYDKKSPILIGVNHHGEPYIIEGNHRVAAANQLGLETIPAEVKYWNGGEQAKGTFSPDTVREMALKKPQSPNLQNLRIHEYAPELDPYGNIEALRSISDAAADPAVITAFEADFQRLIKDLPDEKILIDGEEVRLGDLAEAMKEDENLLAAMKTCAIG